MSQIMITYWQILDKDPCVEGWAKLLLAKGFIDQETHDEWIEDDEFCHVELPKEPLPLSDALDTNGIHDTLWALRCLPEHDNLWRKYAWWCADQVKHLTDDQRVNDCLDVIWRYSEGEATDEELREAAREAAWEAAMEAAREAAWAAAREAAWEAARAAAMEAAMEAAREAAMEAAWAAAMEAAREAQESKLKEILESGEFKL